MGIPTSGVHFSPNLKIHASPDRLCYLNSFFGSTALIYSAGESEQHALPLKFRRLKGFRDINILSPPLPNLPFDLHFTTVGFLPLEFPLEFVRATMDHSDSAVASAAANALRHLDLIDIVRVRTTVLAWLANKVHVSSISEQFGGGEGNSPIFGWNNPDKNFQSSPLPS